MRYIKKSQPPLSFIQWLNLANEDWQPSFGNLQHPEKNDVRDVLFSDQKGLCCYCESQLGDKTRIDHFFPQTHYPERELDFDNFLLSCNEAEGEPPHCDSLKGSHDPVDILSPLDPECEGRFRCRTDGTLQSTDEADIEAIKTIEVLGLNSAALVRRRRKSVFEVIAEIAPQEVRRFVSAMIRERADGTLFPYWSVWQQLSHDLRLPSKARIEISDSTHH